MWWTSISWIMFSLRHRTAKVGIKICDLRPAFPRMCMFKSWKLVRTLLTVTRAQNNTNDIHFVIPHSYLPITEGKGRGICLPVSLSLSQSSIEGLFRGESPQIKSLFLLSSWGYQGAAVVVILTYANSFIYLFQQYQIICLMFEWITE